MGITLLRELLIDKKHNIMGKQKVSSHFILDECGNFLRQLIDSLLQYFLWDLSDSDTSSEHALFYYRVLENLISYAKTNSSEIEILLTITQSVLIDFEVSRKSLS